MGIPPRARTDAQAYAQPRPRAHAPARTALPAALAVGVLAATAALSGCSRDHPDPAPPQARTPVDICTDLVAYWVREALRGSKWAGLDWEQKGFSNEQLEIHDEVLALARTRERADGREAALNLADEESRRRCAAASGATGMSEQGKSPP
ncbi:hypothetical protein [Streptomyces sp. NPDC054975]